MTTGERMPSHVGRYRITGVLGPWTLNLRGASLTMGWLYRASDDTQGRSVWIKTLSPDPPSAEAAPGVSSEEAAARFGQEGRVLACLNHPNIISIFELGQHQGTWFTALESLDGTRLSEQMRGGISLRRGIRTLLQVLEGLAHAHERGIIHRDISPPGVFVCTDGRAKLIDFSCSRLLDPASRPAARGSVIGAPSSMSPEQASGSPIDVRADVFSVGALLYELTAGKQAFGGESVVATFFRILHEQPDMGLIPDLPQWQTLRGVITRALQKKADDRYPDANAMRRDLARALEELGSSADFTADATSTRH